MLVFVRCGFKASDVSVLISALTHVILDLDDTYGEIPSDFKRTRIHLVYPVALCMNLSGCLVSTTACVQFTKTT